MAKKIIYDFSRIRSHEKFLSLFHINNRHHEDYENDLLCFALLMCSYVLATGVCMMFVCIPDFSGQIRVYKVKDRIKIIQFCR